VAKILFGPIISQARNAQGSLVFSRGPHGAYTRNRVTPTNPKTASQTTWRGYFKTASQRWSGTLTETQRQAWRAFAMKFRNLTPSGEPTDYTALQLYIRLNVPRRNYFDGWIDNPPLDDLVTQPSTLTINTNASAPQSLTITLDKTTVADECLVVRATTQLLAGKLWLHRWWRNITHVHHPVGYPLNILAAYQARYGNLVAGKRVGIAAFIFRGGNAAHALQVWSSSITT